ncbi:MAG: phosphate ABC transporter permease subunit PstC [Crenarchaeota archaeon]|nr:phosphate ABC transporter permease subunit PstC [Thermoproteota archaeon]
MARDRLFFLSLLPLASLTVAAFLAIAALFVYESLPAFLHEGVELIAGTRWSPSTSPSEAFYGLLPAIVGTAVTSCLALAIAVPLSLGAALFVNEYLPHRLRGAVSTLIDAAAGMPTVVYGLWGLYVLAPLMQSVVAEPLHRYLGFVPLFSCRPVSGYSLLTAGVLLAIMITPYTFAAIYEAYRSLPTSVREAAYSIGATRAQVCSILLPAIRPAILSAALLGLGRAASETVAVTMVVGNAPTLTSCLLSPGVTITSLIATQFGEASLYPYMTSALYAAGLVLLAIGLGLSTYGLVALSRWRRWVASYV